VETWRDSKNSCLNPLGKKKGCRSLFKKTERREFHLLTSPKERLIVETESREVEGEKKTPHKTPCRSSFCLSSIRHCLHQETPTKAFTQQRRKSRTKLPRKTVVSEQAKRWGVGLWHRQRGRERGKKKTIRSTYFVFCGPVPTTIRKKSRGSRAVLRLLYEKCDLRKVRNWKKKRLREQTTLKNLTKTENFLYSFLLSWVEAAQKNIQCWNNFPPLSLSVGPNCDKPPPHTHTRKRSRILEKSSVQREGGVCVMSRGERKKNTNYKRKKTGKTLWAKNHTSQSTFLEGNCLLYCTWTEVHSLQPTCSKCEIGCQQVSFSTSHPFLRPH